MTRSMEAESTRSNNRWDTTTFLKRATKSLCLGMALLTSEAYSLSSERLRILVTAKESGSSFIAALAADGSELTRITDGPNDWSPAWLGPSERIIFLSDKQVKKPSTRHPDDPFFQPDAHLYIQGITDRSRHQLTFGEHKVWLPKASHDGRFVAFLSDIDGPGDLYVVDVSSGFTQRVSRDKRWPLEGATWLTTDRLIYNKFIGDTLEVFAFDLPSNRTEQLTFSSARTKNGYLGLSPDGRHLAMVSRDRSVDEASGILNPQIYTMDIDGKNRLRITHDKSTDYLPSWSPDGQHIVFSQEYVNPRGQKRAKLIAINPDGTGERQLGDSDISSEPTWLPRTSYIIYTSVNSEHSQLHKFDLSTYMDNTVTRGAADYYEPACR